jgi:hypothetical protein
MKSSIDLSRRMALLLPLAACGGREPLRELPPLRYDYLKPLPLNVARVDVGDAPPPSPIEAQAPTPVGAAVRQMAADRLIAGGTSGRAAFVIEEARIDGVSGGLQGVLAVRLDVVTTDNVRAGFAAARVTSTASVPGDLRVALYDLTRQMLDDMNVEFEFQVRRSLREWLQDTTTAPPPAPVEQQELPTPISP